MPARKSNNPHKPLNHRDSSSSSAAQQPNAAVDSARRMWSLATFLLGTMLVWCMLSPQDSVSVFDGAAVPQNLFWLGLAVFTSLAVALVGLHFQFSGRQWTIVGGCLLWYVIATILAGRDNNPRLAWNGFWQVIALGSCYFSARALVAHPHARWSIVLILLAGSLALAFHGLHQVWIEFPADRARYLADPEKVLAEIPGIDAPAGSVARRRFEDRLLYSSEPYATFALANSLAVLLSGGIILLFGLSVTSLRGTSDSKQTTSNTNKSRQTGSTLTAYLALSLAAIALLLCWFLTRSRIAYPALLAGGVYWVLASGSRVRELRRYLTWGLVIGGASFAVGLIWILRNDRLVLSEAPKSLSYRLEYWLATFDMIQDHWLFGIGLGNYQSYYPIYKLPEASEIIADPHNWLLDMLVCLSVPLGCVLAVWLGIKLLLASPDQPARLLPSTNSLSSPRLPEDLFNSQILLWGAGVGGAICAALLGQLNGMSLSIIAMTWLPSVLLVFLLRGCLGTDQANLRVTARAAALTMLVCLLVSGSWQASGLAVPLLLLLIAGNENPIADLKLTESFDSSSRWSKWSVCFLPMAGLLIFLFQCWRPTTTSWSLMQQAMASATPEDQLRLIIAAVESDRLNSEPLRWQAEILIKESELASREQFPRLAEQTLDVIETWLELDSVKSLNWEWAGRQALVLTAKAQNLGLDQQKYLELALGYYQQAVARYPSNVALRAQMAANHAIAGKWPEAKRELDAAVELDVQTPHLDKKLSNQRLWLPLLPEGAEQTVGTELPWIEAEPMTVWMRKAIAEHL